MKSSIVICVYNRGKQVRACLDSLLAMEGAEHTGAGDFELILVDDGSTDDTAEQLADFAARHAEHTITIVRHDRNLGLASARNTGIDHARGELVFFTDSDCVVDRAWLREMLLCFEDPDVAVVTGPVLSPPPSNLAERAYAGSSRTRDTRWHNRRISGGNMGFRRDVVAQFRFDEALTLYCDEDELAWRLSEAGYRFGFAAKATVWHDHPLRMKDYLRMGFRQGLGSARFWYKRGVYLGRDLWPVTAAALALPLGWADVRLLLVSTFFLALQVAAVVFNEHVLKGKPLIETTTVLPVCLLFYACKIGGVCTMWIRFVLGREGAVQRSRRLWRQACRAVNPAGTLR